MILKMEEKIEKENHVYINYMEQMFQLIQLVSDILDQLKYF